MRTEKEIKERMNEIMERLRFNDTNHNLNVFIEYKLIHEYNALEWILKELVLYA